MKIFARPKVTAIRENFLPASDFIQASRKLGCIRYTPVERFSDALQQDGILEVYADNISRAILNKPASATGFITRQRQGMGIQDNLRELFNGQGPVIFLHEEGLLCIAANKKTFAILCSVDPKAPLSERDELSAVIEAETTRSGTPPPITLDRIEGNVRENQDLLAATINGESFHEVDPQLITRDLAPARRRS